MDILHFIYKTVGSKNLKWLQTEAKLALQTLNYLTTILEISATWKTLKLLKLGAKKTTKQWKRKM